MQVFGEHKSETTFTNDQQDAVNDLIDFIAKPWSDTDYIHGLCGKGGTGKALPVTTKVRTKDGWIEIGKCKVGDEIVTPFGGLTKITGVYPQGIRPCYKICFKNGITTVADENHLWTVRTRKLISKYRRDIYKPYDRHSITITTSDLYNSDYYKYSIPLVKSIYGDDKDFIIPPYVLGVLLGDGYLADDKIANWSRLIISGDEEDIIKRCSILLNTEYKMHNDNNYDNVIYCDNSINKELERLELFCHSKYKFIPKDYLYSSIEQRMELLKGLMDTDGCIDKVKGRYRFSTTSKYLKDDFIELCKSLGYNIGISVDNRNRNECYNISVQTNDCIVASDKKISIYNSIIKNNEFYNDHLGIAHISKVSPRETVCISIDSPEKLYVIDDYIVTHNTFVTKYVIQNCKYSSSVIACAAPTHKACRVFSNAIGGKTVDTIQSIFGFKLDVNIDDFDPKNPTFNPIGNIKLLNKEIRVLIIDEASMLNSKLVGYINKICKTNHIKIIYIGDSSQLPPVNEKTSRAFVITSKINYLNEVVRQGENNPISEIINILRSDIAKGKYDIFSYINNPNNKNKYNSEGRGYTVCGSEEFNYLIEQSFNDERYSKNVDMYRIIAYTNAKVTYWNNRIRNMIIKGAERSIITKNDLIMSYSTIVDDFNEIIIDNSEEYIVYDMANFQDPTFDFKCFMIKFQAIHGGKITQPLCVIDHTDKYTLQLYFNTLNNLINDAKIADKTTRGSKWKEYFRFKRKYLLANNILNSYGKIVFSRDIDYGFAITSHKS